MGYRKLWISTLILGLMVSFCSINNYNELLTDACEKGLIKSVGKVGSSCKEE